MRIFTRFLSWVALGTILITGALPGHAAAAASLVTSQDATTNRIVVDPVTATYQDGALAVQATISNNTQQAFGGASIYVTIDENNGNRVTERLAQQIIKQDFGVAPSGAIVFNYSFEPSRLANLHEGSAMVSVVLRDLAGTLVANGASFVHITTVANQSPLTVDTSASSFKVGGAASDPVDNIEVKAGDAVTYTTRLKNSSSTAVTLTPNLTVWNGMETSGRAPVSTASLATVSVPANGILDYTFTPTVPTESGSYMGVGSFTTTDGTLWAPYQLFLFSVAGPTAHLQTLRAEALGISFYHRTLPVVVGITNRQDAKKHTVTNLSLTTTVTTADGTVLGEKTVAIADDADMGGGITVPVELTGKTPEQVKVKLSLKAAGTVIDESTNSLTIDLNTTGMRALMIRYATVLGILILAVLLLIFLIMQRSRHLKRSRYVPLMIFAVLSLGIGFGAKAALAAHFEPPPFWRQTFIGGGGTINAQEWFCSDENNCEVGTAGKGENVDVATFTLSPTPACIDAQLKPTTEDVTWGPSPEPYSHCNNPPPTTDGIIETCSVTLNDGLHNPGFQVPKARAVYVAGVSITATLAITRSDSTVADAHITGGSVTGQGGTGVMTPAFHCDPVTGSFPGMSFSSSCSGWYASGVSVSASMNKGLGGVGSFYGIKHGQADDGVGTDVPGCKEGEVVHCDLDWHYDASDPCAGNGSGTVSNTGSGTQNTGSGDETQSVDSSISGFGAISSVSSTRTSSGVSSTATSSTISSTATSSTISSTATSSTISSTATSSTISSTATSSTISSTSALISGISGVSSISSPTSSISSISSPTSSVSGVSSISSPTSSVSGVSSISSPTSGTSSPSSGGNGQVLNYGLGSRRW